MTHLNALHEAATPAPWEADDSTVYDSGNEILAELGYNLRYDADAALIVSLRNAYADGTLVPAAKYDALVEAFVTAINNGIACNGYCDACDSDIGGGEEHMSDCTFAALREARP